MSLVCLYCNINQYPFTFEAKRLARYDTLKMCVLITKRQIWNKHNIYTVHGLTVCITICHAWKPFKEALMA